MGWVIWGYIQRILLLFSLRKYDVVYIFLWVTPFGPSVLERLFCWVNPHVVYDIDDAIFLKANSLVNRYVDWMKGRNKPFFLMKAAQHVVTCTPYLTEVAERYNKKVTDISSTINTETYIPVNAYHNNDELILGWSGSHSTAQFLHLLTPVLQELSKRRPFKLVVMGDAHFTMEGVNVEALAWTAEREVPTLQRFDIGLYPLPLDNDWVLGKSGLKALQYMAVGVPVIATAIGTNFRIMVDGENGFLVTTENEWLARLEELMDNPALRKRFGLAGRDNVEAHYSIHANAPVYLDILQRVSR
jgi:glycosyltransferase involved in cell wall biosynthesis